MNSGTSFCAPITSNSSCVCNICYIGSPYYDASANSSSYIMNYAISNTSNLYEDFLDSLSDTSYNKHTAADIRFAKKYFSNYLSEDELVTKQKTGRFWEVSNCGCPAINILLDDDTVLTVWYDTVEYTEKIEERDIAVLPENIRYKKYKGDEQ